MRSIEQKKENMRIWFEQNCPYQMLHWSDFDYTILNRIWTRKRNGRGMNVEYNDIIIAADTETSKKPDREDNHVVAWTITLRAFNTNIATLYGHRPSTFIKALQRIQGAMSGEMTVIYFHYLAYDYAFLRKFLFEAYGTPTKQLNTKSRYPILLQWGKQLMIKDSLILAQRSLDKWAKDMDVEHQKALGKWDYDKLRNQSDTFTSDELEYIEHDTLALAECINALMNQLNKNICSIPYTATGIPREQVRKLGKKYDAHGQFLKQVPTFVQYQKQERIYHGGYTHANRHMVNTTISAENFGNTICYDFSSSYPYCMLSERYPCESFNSIDPKPIEWILERRNDYAFMFTLIMIKPRLKDDFIEMPVLQYSKCLNTINAIVDNGRILCAEYVEIEVNEIDAALIYEQYTWDRHVCDDVEVAKKAYLPRWFTDYVYECYENKCKLKKGGDPVAYALSKSVVNSLYGMSVQKWIKPNIVEDFDTGDYITEELDFELAFNKYIQKFNSILPYTIGIWVTSYAMQNLFELGKCCDTWIYSDTDSCYGCGWDAKKLESYNDSVMFKLHYNSYDCVRIGDKEYWPGFAEFDGEYSEFRVVGSKRYCCRSAESGKLKITVAGVPKKGVEALNDDIENFKKGFIFPASVTNKITHTYIYVDEIYIDEQGNETGDSINLTPCDYLLDTIQVYSVNDYVLEDEVTIYEE